LQNLGEEESRHRLSYPVPNFLVVKAVMIENLCPSVKTANVMAYARSLYLAFSDQQ
jgi:hypothetical protein